MPSKKKSNTITVNDNDVLIENINNNNYDDGFPKYYPPSRHLKAAQAAAASSTVQLQQQKKSAVYPSTSKADKAKAGQQPNKKLTAAEVQEYLVKQGFLDPSVIVTDNWEDPYTQLDKWRMHDSWRRDGTVRRAITLLASFVFGRRTKNVLDTNEDFDTNEDQAKAVEKISTNTTYQDYKDQLNKIDRAVNFDKHSTNAYIQMLIYGRALLIIQDDPQTGLPIALKLCSSMRLGRVFIDELKWQIVAVEYLDYQGYDAIIPAQKMIYLTNLDCGVSPYTQGFGYSALETVLDTSETNRQIQSVAIKEINKSFWIPFLVVKYVTKKKSLMQKLAVSIKPGVPFIHNQDLTWQTIKLESDLMKLLEEQNFNDKKIARDIGVPSPLIGHEAVTNRATTGAVIDTWEKTQIEKERTSLRGIFEPQWNDRNLSKITKLSQDAIIQQEWKIKKDFENIPLDVSLEIAQPVDVLVGDGVIDKTKARELLRFTDIEARMQEAETEQQKLELQKTKMMADATAKAGQKQQQGEGSPNTGPSSGQAAPTSKPGGGGKGGLQQVTQV